MLLTTSSHITYRKILPYICCTNLSNSTPNILNISRKLASSQEFNSNSLSHISKDESLKRFKVIERLKKNKIPQLSNNGSFIRSLLLYDFEDKIFKLPNIFEKQEFLTLKFRNDWIMNNFHKIIEDDNRLNDLGFFNLSHLTVNEIIYIFEAIGRNISIKISDINISEYLNENLEGKVHQLGNYPSLNSKVIKALMKLILKNFLNSNQREEDTIKQSKLNELLSQNKIGFAWNDCEGRYFDDIKNWSTSASLASDNKSWILNGSKRGILKDNYDYYLVFAQTNDFLSKVFFFDDKTKKYLPTGLVGLIVPAKLITDVKDDITISGIEYQKILFQYLELNKNNCEIIGPSIFDCFNQKGIALLSISAFILGQLKLLSEECYNYFIENNITFTKGIENKLCLNTSMIYTLESCLHMTARIYDQMNEPNTYPEMYYESCICKIIAIDYAKKIIFNLQSCYSSRAIIISPLIEFIDCLDNFLGTSEELLWYIGDSYSNDFCLHLRTAGFTPKITNELNLSKLELFLEKEKLKSKKVNSIRPPESFSITEQINVQTDTFLNTVSRIYDVIEIIVSKWILNPDPRSYYEEHRIANLSIQLYINASLIARLNSGLKSNNPEIALDLLMFTIIAEKALLQSINWSDELERSDYDTNGGRNHFLHYANVKLKGYFAPHPLYEQW